MKNLKNVVAVVEKYSDNDGAYSVAIVWNGEELSSVCFANGYNGGSYDDVTPNASAEVVAVAAQWFKENTKSPCGIGHTYTIGGSRKLAKGTKVVVLNADMGGYSERYGHYEAPRALVQTEAGDEVWVSQNCLKEWVTGVLPYWA